MFPLPEIFSKVSNFIGKKIIFIALIILFLGVIGIFQLRVENSFIDYFKNNSEIYKGMKLIDQKLGGTTLLDITVDLEEELSEEIYVDEDSIFEDDEFDFLEEDSESMNSTNQLFFTSSKMELISNIHTLLKDDKVQAYKVSYSALRKSSE